MDYLDQIGRIPLLDAPRERELAHRVRAGRAASSRLAGADAGEQAALTAVAEDGRRARDEMIGANLRLVVTQARRLPRGRVPFLDLVQEGNVGLMAAVDRFDPDLGFKFSTYAHDWIAQALWAALATDRLIRLPVKAGARASACRRVLEDLAGAGEPDPDVDDLAAATGFAADQVEVLLRAEQPTVPLDLVAHAAAACVDADEPLRRRDAAELVAQALGGLDADERAVLELRFGLGVEACTLAETARRTGSDVPTVRRLERRALNRLRQRPSMVQLQEAAGA